MRIYRWYTFGCGRDEYWWLKLGPVTLDAFCLSNGRLCLELHARGRLLLAVPDWRIVGL